MINVVFDVFLISVFLCQISHVDASLYCSTERGSVGIQIDSVCYNHMSEIATNFMVEQI